VLMMVEVVVLGGSRVQGIVFVIVSVFAVVSVIAVVGVVICLVVVGGSIRKSSATSSAALAVDCIGGCCLWEVKLMAGGSPVIVFLVLLCFWGLWLLASLPSSSVASSKVVIIIVRDVISRLRQWL